MAKKKTLAELQEEHSEMCATAADLGMRVPEDLTVDFDSTELGNTVVSNLDALIRKFKSGLDSVEKEHSTENKEVASVSEKAQNEAKPKPKAAVAKTTKATKEAAKVAPSIPAGEEQVAAKKTVAKKTAAKAKANGAAPKKAAAVAPKAAKKAAFDENAKIAWGNKDNPARKTSGRFERVEKVRQHSGKTVKTFLANKGRADTLKNCVRLGLCKVA